MEFSLSLPPHLDKDGVLFRQWTNFSQRFRYHRSTSSSQDPSVTTPSALLFAASNQIDTICTSLQSLDMDLPKLNKVLEVVEQACLPQFILLFERFRYFTLEQEASETLNDFIHVLRKQVELCEFGDLKDSIMTNALVNGVIDEQFKQNLQNSGGLCFDDAVSMCSAENSNKSGAVGDRFNVFTTKKHAGPKKKALANAQRNMYMLPVYENANDEVEADDPIVKTIMNLKGPKTRAGPKTRKKKASSSKSLGSKRVKLFLCYKCDNEYATRKSLRRHVHKKHASGKDFYCQHCETTFGSFTECLTHCKGHTTLPSAGGQPSSWRKSADTEYLCWYCDQKFSDLAEYKLHSATHTAVRVFSCDLCQKKNHNVTRMIGHLKGHLIPRHKCEICGNCFGRPELLTAHLQTHADKPAHQCQVCGKSFVTADRLQCHMRTHSGEKRFTCELCGKSFSQKMSFDYHKRWHAGEKPYECDICGRRARSFGDLRKHKRMHSDKRPYVCEVCGKSFRFISNLNRHRKGHSGKRSFVCDVCGRSFIYGEGLRDHIKAGRCPGRKNEGGVNKTTQRGPRVKGPSIPHPPNPQMEHNDFNPANFTSPHSHPHAHSHSQPPPEAFQHEFPTWQYLLSRNNEQEGPASMVIVPPFY